MSRKSEDNEPANEENKQFGPGGNGGNHRFESRYTRVIFFFRGMYELWMPGSFFLLLTVCLFCVVSMFCCRKIRW